jgi:hypothetical protein
MDQHFIETCRSLSREFDAPDIDELATDGYIEVEGIGLGLELAEERSPMRLTFRVDLGAVDDRLRTETLEEALAINLCSGDSGHGSIGWDEDSDHLVLMRSFDWEPELEVQVIAEAMRRLARYSGEFRDAMKSRLQPEGLAAIDIDAVFG